MQNYIVTPLNTHTENICTLLDNLYQQEGIRCDANLDYTCGIYNSNMKLIATGSCFANTIRCLAVDHSFQGEGLLNKIVSHLIEHLVSQGIFHIFLYTKCSTAKFFQSLGFYEIARVTNELVFMENKKIGFQNFLNHLEKQTIESTKIASIVMNANPFTNGHLFLVEKASKENDILHIFLVSEDVSLFPLSIRKQLVKKATTHLSNIIYHETGPYMISSATFPSYFQPDTTTVAQGHALLDLQVFSSIAQQLQITKRYVGDEPTSIVTNLYNQTMTNTLPAMGIDCVIVPRQKENGIAISASLVRLAIRDNNIESLQNTIPPSTYDFLTSSNATPIIEAIKNTENLIHH